MTNAVKAPGATTIIEKPTLLRTIRGRKERLLESIFHRGVTIYAGNNRFITDFMGTGRATRKRMKYIYDACASNADYAVSEFGLMTGYEINRPRFLVYASRQEDKRGGFVRPELSDTIFVNACGISKFDNLELYFESLTLHETAHSGILAVLRGAHRNGNKSSALLRGAANGVSLSNHIAPTIDETFAIAFEAREMTGEKGYRGVYGTMHSTLEYNENILAKKDAGNGKYPSGRTAIDRALISLMAPICMPSTNGIDVSFEDFVRALNKELEKKPQDDTHRLMGFALLELLAIVNGRDLEDTMNQILNRGYAKTVMRMFDYFHDNKYAASSVMEAASARVRLM